MASKTSSASAVTPLYPYAATFHLIDDRGRPPISFLNQLVTWGRKALKDSPEIFAPNHVALDAYAAIKSRLATHKGDDMSDTPVYMWESLLHRAGAMLELMRVHAGRESSWKPKEGVDKTNKTSISNKVGEEAGIFQVSYNSTWLDSVEGKDIMGAFIKARGIDTVEKFIAEMKKPEDGMDLEFEYYARLVRVSIAWAGPLLRHGSDSVYPYLSRDSMREFMSFLETK